MKAKPRIYNINLFDLSVLLYNLRLSEIHKNVGYLDANRSIGTLLGKLNRSVALTEDELESLIFASNLLDEEGGWRHPLELDFKTWAANMVGPGKLFNRVYNLIEDR